MQLLDSVVQPAHGAARSAAPCKAAPHSQGVQTLLRPSSLLSASSGLSCLQGWSAFAAEMLPAGAFLCQYAGELLPAAEARTRLRDYEHSGVGHALLVSMMGAKTACLCAYLSLTVLRQQVVRELLPSGRAALRLNIDATRTGNAAHFFNHRWALVVESPTAWALGLTMNLLQLRWGQPCHGHCASTRESDPCSCPVHQA